MSHDSCQRVDGLDPSRRLDQVREVADAVLYEGYLLYPYRASSSKNQARWQFGVLGPPGAARDGLGEDPTMSMQCLLRAPQDADPGTVEVRLRCLQLQVREVQARDAGGDYLPVPELTVDGRSVLTWDEAVEQEVALGPATLSEPFDTPVEIAGGEDIEELVAADGTVAGRIVRRRMPLRARVRFDAATGLADRDAGSVPQQESGHGAGSDGDGRLLRLSVEVSNEHPDPVADQQSAIRSSLIGAHLILRARGAGFVSVIDPPEDALEVAARCRQQRCWPVLAGAPGSTDVVLGAPIILYDYPEVAAQSHGALFDATEIDEILTLRVMTMTEAEKAEARATDPRAREVIDRCDAMTMQDLQQLHGILRDPRAADPQPRPPAQSPPPQTPAQDRGAFDTGDVPWWDPEADAEVSPGTDSVVVDGVTVSRGSLVRVHPSRRADAQDLFFAAQVARVTAVLHDVDGFVHVALVLVDDPAADLHDWYGRYFYFAPDEIEPLSEDSQPPHREESHQ